jgi:tripartite-type tricarboxylate transporter receptor subunit TctC
MFPCPTRRQLFGAGLGLGLAGAAVAVHPSMAAENWPSRPVRLLIPFPPGQATDTILRYIADELSKRWPPAHRGG